MSDLIRREDAIEIIDNECRCTDKETDLSGLNLAISLLESLPSADSGRYIDRAKLFNRLAYIKAPPEANEYKAEVYMLIQNM